MHTMPGPPRRTTRLARALGLDGNPLRRASDRAEAWIRVGLLAVFLIVGPLAAVDTGHWAYHAGITAARAPAVQAHPAATGLARADGGGRAWVWAREGTRAPRASARGDEVLATVMTLACTALALLAAQRLTVAFLRRRRLAAWETAWSRVGPQWSGHGH